MGSQVSALLDKAEESGFDRGNAWHIVAASFPAAVAFGVFNATAEKSVYRPLGFKLARMQDVPGAPEVIAVKWQSWCHSFLGHCVMTGLWWKYVSESKSMGWVLDHRNWTAALFPRIHDTEERRQVGPYYIMYFSYVLHTCYKDMLKSAGRKGGAQQVLFDLHHVLTVGLVATSISTGTWRCGVLTRMIHDVGDIVLYAAMLRRALYETRGGDPSTMHVWFLANNVVWPGTRILLYGYLNVRMYNMLRKFNKLKEEDKDPEVKASLNYYRLQIVGSALMLLLQFAFYKGLLDATRDFKRTGGKIVDPFHGSEIAGMGTVGTTS